MTTQERIRNRIQPYQDTRAAALVRKYDYLLSGDATQARRWLSGLETILNRAREYDRELDQRLAAILQGKPLPRPKPPVVHRWIETDRQPKTRRTFNLNAPTTSVANRSKIKLQSLA